MAPKTAEAYLTGVKVAMQQLLPESNMWINTDWYSNLRFLNLNKMITQNNMFLNYRFRVSKGTSTVRINEGKSLVEKPEPIGRRLLQKMTEGLMERGDTASMLKRAALITYLSCGRSGEIARLSWNSVAWDYEEDCIKFHWMENKTCEEKILNFFCDSESVEIDFYNALGCYLITTEFCHDGFEHWVFLRLQRDCAGVVNR